MLKPTLVQVALLGSTLLMNAQNSSPHSFKKTQLSDKFWCEGATFGDLNRDRRIDIVSGPYWYEGPDFQKRHQFYPPTKTFVRKKTDGGEETIEGFEGALGEKNTYSD